MRDHTVTLPRAELEELERKASKLDNGITLERFPGDMMNPRPTTILTVKGIVNIDNSEPPGMLKVVSGDKVYYYRLN